MKQTQTLLKQLLTANKTESGISLEFHDGIENYAELLGVGVSFDLRKGLPIKTTEEEEQSFEQMCLIAENEAKFFKEELAILVDLDNEEKHTNTFSSWAPSGELATYITLIKDGNFLDITITIGHKSISQLQYDITIEALKHLLTAKRNKLIARHLKIVIGSLRLYESEFDKVTKTMWIEPFPLPRVKFAPEDYQADEPVSLRGAKLLEYTFHKPKVSEGEENEPTNS